LKLCTLRVSIILPSVVIFFCQTDDGTSKRAVISTATLRVICFVTPPASFFVMCTSNVQSADTQMLQILNPSVFFFILCGKTIVCMYSLCGEAVEKLYAFGLYRHFWRAKLLLLGLLNYSHLCQEKHVGSVVYVKRENVGAAN